MGFVDMAAGEIGDQLAIADLVAEASDHGGDLGVENLSRDGAEEEEEDFDVLAAGVEDFYPVWIGEQGA